MIVTRWFGGTKLGKGGLIRAYSSCAAATLSTLPHTIRKPVINLNVHCSYNLIGLVEAVATHYNGKVLGGDYGETVTLRVKIPLESEGDFKSRLVDESGGKALISSD